METQNPLKQRLTRMFRSSLGSCKPKNISDVIDHPNNRQHYQLMDLFSPKPSPFPSLCRPNCSETELLRPKVSDRNSLLSMADSHGRLFDFEQSGPNPKEKKTRKKTKKKTQLRKRSNFESFDDYYDWFSTDDDETTLFSSKSLSSDSSGSFPRKKDNYRRRRAPKANSEVGSKLLKGKVKDSFAVVKHSSDPYGDFRASMVEMIIERQIFGARELEHLLQTFLSLNSDHHHKVIVQVFTEILETLFSNWS
ncbi:Transcription repressor like [Actinidia chinensis var. chinensis]|uniref:Transcription repressor n=1 Tax=Actinidia chinensis var. chinensis TaxID=1590841 RepID=A0A2R6QV14_ACTCC|nr:Transcription repressor like [Actinidia chinensis var. chinensis]